MGWFSGGFDEGMQRLVLVMSVFIKWQNKCRATLKMFSGDYQAEDMKTRMGLVGSVAQR